MDTIKDKLNFNKIGKKIKKVNDGITISKVELDKSIIFFVSRVSEYNQIKAKKVVRGIETIKPAKRDERLAISATITTTIAVISILIRKYITFLFYNKFRGHNAPYPKLT